MVKQRDTETEKHDLYVTKIQLDTVTVKSGTLTAEHDHVTISVEQYKQLQGTPLLQHHRGARRPVRLLNSQEKNPPSRF